MKAQSDAYPPGGFWQIVRNMQSRICHKNWRHMPSIKETSFLNFCLLGIGMAHKRRKQSPKNSPQNKDLVIHIYLHWSTTCTWYIWTTSFLAVFQRFKVVLISATPTVDKFTTLFLFVIIIISWKWTLTRSWLFWKWTNYNTRSKNICIFDLSIISDIYFLLTIMGNWFLHSVFIRGGWYAVKRYFQQYFSYMYIVAISFIGRKPLTCRKSLTYFIT